MGNNASSRPVFLTVTHNGHGHIAKLLGSIPEGSRVVIVDNASSDQTLEAARPFNGPLGLEIVTLPTNKGYAAGINAGMRHIGDSSDWVFVLNQDIVINAPFGKRGWGDLAERLKAQYSPYAIIQPRILLPDGTVNVDELCMNVWGFAYPPDYATAPRPKDPMETFFFSGAAFLLNAPKYHEVGPFDESLFLYYEEIDYAFRLAARGEKVLFDPTWGVTHDYALSTASGRKMRLLFKNRPTVLGRYAPNLWRRLALLGPSRGPRDEKGRKRILSILLPRLSLGFHTRQFHPAIRLMANILAVPCALLIKAILRKRLARD